MRTNISKYYLYKFFNSLAFFSPVLVLFWQSRGLSLTQIMLLESIYSLGVVALELPTGAFADYIGKRISLILGSLFFTVGLCLYGISIHFWHFVIGELIVAIGMALISGTDRAFIHETLRELNREKEYKKIEGKAQGIGRVAQVIGNLFGGMIGSISLSLTLIITGISTLIGSFVGISFTKTTKELPREEETNYLGIIKESLKIVHNNRRLLWLILFFSSFNALIWSINWFAQPYLQKLNVPIVYFGIIFAAFSLLSAFASTMTEKFEKITQDKIFLILSLTATIVMFLIGKFPSIYIIPLWAIFGMFRAMNEIIVSDKVLTIIPQNRTATILSFQNLLRRLIYAIVGPILGWIGDSFGIETALQLNALFLFIITGSLLLIRKDIFKKHEK